LQAVRAQRAIACRAPSLAVARTMHHFTIATLMEIDHEDPGPEAELLEFVARGNLYVASGFAEGRTGPASRHPPCAWTGPRRHHPQRQQEAMQPVAVHGPLHGQADKKHP
jgi:hypothetical protein